MSSRTAAFFDLDRTLIDINSGKLYAAFEYRNGRLTRLQLVQTSLWLVFYHLSLIDLERAYRHALRKFFRGSSSAELTVRTRDWFFDEVFQRIQPGARAALDDHRSRGEPLVLLTNSSSYMATVACEAFELDDWIANHFPTDDQGCLTGDFESPLCYGPGKVARAERWAAERDIDLDQSTFYTDSYSDLAMLERVGFPRVVNPDPRLRWAARRRGWPVLDWRTVATRPADGASAVGGAA